MWRRATSYLVLASLGLNVAFVGVWVARAWPARPADQPQSEPAIWCPLHRALEASPRQWAEIESRLREFQTAVGELRSRIDVMRSEVIDLVAAEKPDLDAIHAKQEDILATKRRIQRLVVEHLLSEREILTAEQQQRLFTMLRDRICCGAGPPMSGRPFAGLGRVLQHRDAGPSDDVNQ